MKTELVNDVLIVILDGYHLDESNVRQLKTDIKATIKNHNKLLLDLTNLTFIDSSGLGGILSILRNMKEQGGDLKICNASSSIQSVFELIRLPRLIDIHESRETGVRSFQD